MTEKIAFTHDEKYLIGQVVLDMNGTKWGYRDMLMGRLEHHLARNPNIESSHTKDDLINEVSRILNGYQASGVDFYEKDEEWE